MSDRSHLRALRGGPCAACGEVLPAGTERCESCGSPVFPAAVRVVTMLCVDLEGYTAFSAGRDAEEVHLLVRPLMNRLRRACELAGAVVPVIEGDGFLGVFGALEGRVDDPRRALHAAVQLQYVLKAHRVGAAEGFPTLRVALHVGEVVVAPSWERGGFSVAGDAVNVASRLCGLARGGSVIASAEFAALVPEDAWLPQTQQVVRNRPMPVDVRELAWEEVRLPGLLRRPVSQTEFVSRPEVDEVLAAIQEGTDLQLVGEPGMGKTRVAREVASRLSPEQVFVLSCLDDDTESKAVEALAAEVVGALRELPGRDLPAMVWRRLRALGGEAFDTVESDDRGERLSALIEGLRALAQRERVLLVIEDAHWAQQDERALLTALNAAPGERDFPILVTTRVRVPAPARCVVLVPLPRDLAARLVGLVMPGAEDGLVEALVSRAGGVPLAVEQYARLLLEDGTVVEEHGRFRLASPAGLAALPVGMRLFVSARLDRLDPEARAVVASAAVAGRTADADLVRYLSGCGDSFLEILSDLVSKGILRHEGSGGPLRVAFTHQVLQDVAYGTLLRQQRVDQHLVAAQWYSVLPIAQLFSEEARHLEAAITQGAADCEVVRRAVLVLAEYAASLVGNRTALATEVIDRAERIVGDHPQCEVDTLRLRVTKAETLRLQMREDEAVALADACAQEARLREDSVREAEASVVAGTALALADPASARDRFRRAEEVFVREGDRAGLARVAVARAELFDVLLPERLRIMEDAFGAAVRAGDKGLSARVAQDLAMCSPSQHPEMAERWALEAEKLVQRHDVVGPAQILFATANTFFVRQERQAAIEALRLASMAAEQAVFRTLVLNCEVLLLNALVESGALDQAEAVCSRLLDLASTRPTDRLRYSALLPLALARSRRGDVSGSQLLVSSLEEASAALSTHHVAEWHEMRARLAQDVGDFDVAAEHAQAARHILEELGLMTLALRVECIDLASRTAGGSWIGLGEMADARARARELRSDFALALLSLGRQLTDLLTGARDHEPELHESVPEIEVRALALEVRALWEREPDLLLESAATWSQLGTTVWPARALLWHSALTGTPHHEADELLEVLQSPAGLAEHFRSQVRGLRA